MTGFLTENIGWKLLSLAAALVLWFFVASEPELATLHSVPVEYKGVPDDLEISSNFVESVFLEMRGPAGRLRDLSDTRPAVVLDFSTVHEPGERTFTIDQSHAILPRGVEVVRAIPSQVRRFERRISRDCRWRCGSRHRTRVTPPRIGSSRRNHGHRSGIEARLRTRAAVTDPDRYEQVYRPRTISSQYLSGGTSGSLSIFFAGDCSGCREDQINLGKQLFGTDGIRGVAGSIRSTPYGVCVRPGGYGQCGAAPDRAGDPDRDGYPRIRAMDCRTGRGWIGGARCALRASQVIRTPESRI